MIFGHFTAPDGLMEVFVHLPYLFAIDGYKPLGLGKVDYASQKSGLSRS
jgi:hypothetical protein